MALLGCHPYLQVMTHLSQHSALLGGLSLNFCCETADLPLWLEGLHSFFTSSKPNEVEFTMNEEIKLLLKYCAIDKFSVHFKKLIMC